MQNTLITATIIAFGILLLANIFFRIRTFITFKKLAEKGIGFERAHVFDRNRLQKEILLKYPNDQKLILSHVNSIKLSLRISALCMFVLTLCGAVLMYYRNS